MKGRPMNELERLEKKRDELLQVLQQATAQRDLAQKNVDRIGGAIGCLNEQIAELVKAAEPKNRAERRAAAKAATKGRK